jgi:hypothetical protein
MYVCNLFNHFPLYGMYIINVFKCEENLIQGFFGSSLRMSSTVSSFNVTLVN